MNPYYYSWSIQSEVIDFSLEATLGPYLISGENSVLDCISSSFQAHFGHSYEPILSAMSRQMNDFSIASPKASFGLKSEASQKLLNLLKLEGSIFYTVSGAESVENALKMARQIRQANKILARKKSYHGASLGALSVTGDWRSQNHFGLQDYTIRIPEPSEDIDLAKLKSIVRQEGTESIAAICLETISGTNGVYSADPKWWVSLREFCDETGILLIVDEVLVGFGRCGENFAFQKYKIKPDIVCMSKGITGGYIPFGAVYTSPKIYEFYNERMLSAGLTNYAHPLGLACMDIVIDTLNELEFSQRKNELEKVFAEGVHALAKLDEILDYRLHGFLVALDTSRNDLSWRHFWDAGLYVYIKDGMLILAPPFILNESHLQRMFEVIYKVLKRA